MNEDNREVIEYLMTSDEERDRAAFKFSLLAACAPFLFVAAVVVPWIIFH